MRLCQHGKAEARELDIVRIVYNQSLSVCADAVAYSTTTAVTYLRAAVLKGYFLSDGSMRTCAKRVRAHSSDTEPCLFLCKSSGSSTGLLGRKQTLLRNVQSHSPFTRRHGNQACVHHLSCPWACLPDPRTPEEA
jgi:hypothetical protein